MPQDLPEEPIGTTVTRRWHWAAQARHPGLKRWTQSPTGSTRGDLTRTSGRARTRLQDLLLLVLRGELLLLCRVQQPVVVPPKRGYLVPWAVRLWFRVHPPPRPRVERRGAVLRLSVPQRIRGGLLGALDRFAGKGGRGVLGASAWLAPRVVLLRWRARVSKRGRGRGEDQGRGGIIIHDPFRHTYMHTQRA